MAVIFPILSTFDAAGVNKAQRAFKGLSGTAKVGAIAFSALGIAATKFGADAVSAAAQDQKAQLKLAKTLENVTGATDQAIAATEQFITAQQFATGVSDNQLRPALETLVRATGDVTKAQELLKLGLDVSAGSGRDLESISLALAKAQGGQFTALQRLGIVIPENIKKSKDFGQVQEYLNGLFGGQAAVAAGTYEGKLAILGERMGEVKETLGGALIPVLTRFADKVLKDVMPSIEVFVNALTGQTSVSSSLSQSEQTALNWGNTIRAVFQTVINYRGEIVAFGAVIVGVFAVAKIAAAASAIVSIIKGVIGVYRALQTAAVLAATASAFASGGLSVGAGIAGAAVGVAAVTATLAGVNAVVNTYQKNVADLPKIEIAPDGIMADAKVYKDVVLPTVDEVGKSGKKAGKGIKEIGDAGKYAKQQIAAFTDQLSKANGVLDNAREAYASFKSSVSDTLNGILDFGAAATAETGSFVENLVAQAAKAANFGTKIQQLLGMGLSESAIAKVLEAGADAGTKIADEIIAGGATVVNQVNSLITATQTVADAVGESAASQFYTAGVTAGQALVDGVKAAIAAAGFAVNTEGVVVNQAGIDQVNAAVAKARTKKSKGGKKITKGEKKTISDLANALGVDIPAMAAGGIVTGPTLALIGEAGPEAVIPLNRNNTPTGNTINLTVNAGMGADGNQIGREIVDAIKRYERISGPVFKSA
jgi:hypothetical protein